MNLLSVLPNRWDDEYGDVRVAVLVGVMTIGELILPSTYAFTEANAFLVSGLVAILVMYWTPPIKKETYVHWILSYGLFMFGIYVSLFKLPHLFEGLIGLRAAQFLCVIVYTVTCWFLIRLKAKSLRENNPPSDSAEGA